MGYFAGEDTNIRAGVIIANDGSSTPILELSYGSRESAIEQVGLFSMLDKVARRMRVDTEGVHLRLMVEFSRGWTAIVEVDVDSALALDLFRKATESGMLILSIGIHQDINTFLPMTVFMVDMKTCVFCKVSSPLKEAYHGLDRLV